MIRHALICVTFGLAVAAPTNLWDSHRHIHGKLAKLHTAQLDLSGMTGSGAGSGSLSADDLAKMQKMQEEMQNMEKQYNQTCLPAMETFSALKTDTDCVKMQGWKSPPNTADGLRDYCSNTCLSKFQDAKKAFKSSDCKKTMQKMMEVIGAMMGSLGGMTGMPDPATGSGGSSSGGSINLPAAGGMSGMSGMPNMDDLFEDDDDTKAAIRGVGLMCKQEAGEYCLLAVQRVSQIDIDTVNWDNDTEADAALNTYCSPCMDAMAPMLKSEGKGNADLEKKLQVRHLICNRDNNKNFCWKQVARFAKLSKRTTLRQAKCAAKNCAGPCRLVGCSSDKCEASCVNSVDAVNTVFGGKNPFEKIAGDMSTTAKIQTMQATTLPVTEEDYMEDVNLVRSLLATREKISDICENNCFQRGIGKLAQFLKSDNRADNGDKLQKIADNLCKRNEAKELCLTKLVSSDFPAGCSLREIQSAGTCNTTCKDAIKERINGLACCAPFVLRAWAVSERVGPSDIKKLLTDSKIGCGFDLSDVECPAKVETIKKSLHLGLDFAWYKNLTDSRKQEFHAGVEEDLNRLLYPATVSVTQCTEGSVVAETAVNVDTTQTTAAQTSATFDSQSTSLQLDSTSAQVAQDQPFTTATVVTGGAAPVPAEGSNAGMIAGIIVGVIAAVAIIAIIAVIVMKKRQAAPSQNQQELSTTLNP